MRETAHWAGALQSRTYLSAGNGGSESSTTKTGDGVTAEEMRGSDWTVESGNPVVPPLLWALAWCSMG